MKTSTCNLCAKTFALLLTVSSLLAIFNPVVLSGAEPSLDPVTGDANRAREQEFLEIRARGSGPISSADYDRAMEQWRQLQKTVPQPSEPFTQAAVSGVNGTVWKPIGPSPIIQGTSRVNGRVN